MPTFLNLAEYLLQQAVKAELTGKDSVMRSMKMWAKGSFGLAEHFRNHGDFYAARSEQLFHRAWMYEMTGNVVGTPAQAVENLVVETAAEMPS